MNKSDEKSRGKESQKLSWPGRRQKVFDGLLVGGLDRVLPSHCKMTRLPSSGHSTRVRAHLSVPHQLRAALTSRSLVPTPHMCSPPRSNNLRLVWAYASLFMCSVNQTHSSHLNVVFGLITG